jgi:hypothetical protein
MTKDEDGIGCVASPKLYSPPAKSPERSKEGLQMPLEKIDEQD